MGKQLEGVDARQYRGHEKNLVDLVKSPALWLMTASVLRPGPAKAATVPAVLKEDFLFELQEKRPAPVHSETITLEDAMALSASRVFEEAAARPDSLSPQVQERIVLSKAAFQRENWTQKSSSFEAFLNEPVFRKLSEESQLFLLSRYFWSENPVQFTEGTFRLLLNSEAEVERFDSLSVEEKTDLFRHMDERYKNLFGIEEGELDPETKKKLTNLAIRGSWDENRLLSIALFQPEKLSERWTLDDFLNVLAENPKSITLYDIGEVPDLVNLDVAMPMGENIDIDTLGKKWTALWPGPTVLRKFETYNVDVDGVVTQVKVAQRRKNQEPGETLDGMVEMLAGIPSELRPFAEKVLLTARSSRGGAAAVSRSDRVIRVYTDIDSHALIHEIAHKVSFSSFGRNEKAPGWTSWKEAAKQDGLLPSGYAGTEVMEDFAEAFTLFIQSLYSPAHETLRAHFPHRFALMDQVYADIKSAKVQP